MYSDDVRDEWADRSGEYSPAYYAYRGPDETSESVRAVLAEHLPSDAAVMELGCGPGRHLAHLHEAGFSNLSGLDVNDESFDVLAEEYPQLDEVGEFTCDTIESAVPGFADDRFDAVYSVETLQHIHPDEAWVFAEIARVAGEIVVTVENEGDGDPSDENASGDSTTEEDADDPPDDDPEVNYVREDIPLYYRDWASVFGDLGCEQLRAESRGRDTMRVFRTP
ncbi:class I SAM-dependent methyltransferase [Salinirubrum litoreum]|uniref:Class I SAM-dependent methyltransferase n=1 Tax=Salinirubrum litoreum TaxID=1126234 RepID=A0ABD5R8Q3_9EURY